MYSRITFYSTVVDYQIFTVLYFLGLDVFDMCTLKFYRHCCLPDGPKLKDVRTCRRKFTRVKLFSNKRRRYRETVHVKINNFIFVCVCIVYIRIPDTEYVSQKERNVWVRKLWETLSVNDCHNKSVTYTLVAL